MSLQKRFLGMGCVFLLTGGMILSDLQAGEGNPVVFENARFTVITPVCIRMEYSDEGGFIDMPSLFAVQRQAPETYFIVEKNDTAIVIQTERVRLVYQPDGQSFHKSNLSAWIQKGRERVYWTPGMKGTGNLGGTLRTLDQVDGKARLPDGLLSRDGWYLLDDSRRPLFSKGWVVRRPENAGVDWYLFGYGYDFKAALKSLTSVGGKIPLPRKYALGSWYSRYWPYLSEDYRQLVKEYREHDFPLDVMVWDMDWHKDGWTGWSWNRELLPDAEELLKWFHRQNLFVTLNVHPADGIGPHEDMYKDFMADMQVDLSAIPEENWPTLPYDASDQKYVTTLFKHTHADKEEAGVDFWWLDWQQFMYTRGNPELKNLEWLNHVYFRYAGRGEKRGISFSRWGGWGDHRHPIHFSGDAHANWPTLAFEVPFTSTAGNVGCFFWSHDIGGHMGGMEAETNTRWIQFGAFSAALRLHSTRDANMDKRPWLAEALYVKSMQIAFHLRSELFPYIYSSVRQSCEESIPLSRPMYIDFSESEDAYHHPQQYQFGDAFLVAPIVSAGTGPNRVASQRIWFPEGVWYNWFTGEQVIGKGQVDMAWADLYEFPLYVRGGIPVPMQPYTQRMATAPLSNLVICVYPGEEKKTGMFILYEDDGISKDYLKNHFATTKLTYYRDKDLHHIVVHPTEGTFDSQLEERTFSIKLVGTRKARDVFVNGKAVKSEYPINGRTNYIVIDRRNIREMTTIEIKAEPVDQVKIREKTMQRLWAGLTDKSFDDLNVENIHEIVHPIENPYDAENVLLFLSGIGFSIDSKQTMVIIKAAISAVDKPMNIRVVDRCGSQEREVFSELIDLPNGSQKVIHVRDPIIEKLGMSTLRKAYLDFYVDGQQYTVSRVLEKRISYLRDWQVAGPFPYDPDVDLVQFHYGPEEQPALDSIYKRKDGIEIRWQKAELKQDGMVDLLQLYGSENSIAYAQSQIVAEKDQKASLQINSDDGVEIWINGDKVFSNHVFRSASSETDRVPVSLKKGKNTVLLKISQGMGGWEFRAALDVDAETEER